MINQTGYVYNTTDVSDMTLAIFQYDNYTSSPVNTSSVSGRSVNQVPVDVWNYNQLIRAGMVSFSGLSSLMAQQFHNFEMELGPVFEQTWGGGQYPSDGFMFNYTLGSGGSSLIKPEEPMVVLKSNADQTYNMTSFGFGVVD